MASADSRSAALVRLLFPEVFSAELSTSVLVFAPPSVICTGELEGMP